MERLAAGLPLPQLALPYQFTADLGPKQLGVLSRALGADIDALVVDEPGVEVEVEELGVDDDD